MKKLFMLLILTSCSLSEVVEISEVEKVDSVVTYKPRPPHPRDTTEVVDTMRIPIGFDVSVGDWEGTEIDL